MLFKIFPKNKEFVSQWLGHLSIGLFIIAAIFTEQFDYEKNISFKKDDNSQIFLDSETEVVLKNIQDIDFIELDQRDVIRHEVVRKIINAYEQKNPN